MRELGILEDCFKEEEEEKAQQQPASAEVAITDKGQRSQPNCSAVCSFRGQRKAQCARCDVGLCVVPYFVEYHTKVNL